MSINAGAARFNAFGRIDVAAGGAIVPTSSPPVTATGAIAVNQLQPVAVYAGGVPFTAAGRVAIQLTAPVAFFLPGGIPITASGRIACHGTDPIAGYVAGLPRTATGAFAVI